MEAQIGTCHDPSHTPPRTIENFSHPVTASQKMDCSTKEIGYRLPDCTHRAVCHRILSSFECGPHQHHGPTPIFTPPHTKHRGPGQGTDNRGNRQAAGGEKPHPQRVAGSGDERARTANPRLAKPVLSQLSYVPVFQKRDEETRRFVYSSQMGVHEFEHPSDCLKKTEFSQDRGAESGAVDAQSSGFEPDLATGIECWPEPRDEVKAAMMAAE